MTEVKFCGRQISHGPHIWSLAAIDGDVYSCKGVSNVNSWDRPDHYGGEENPFEPIKIIEYYGLNFSLGNAIKYVLRAPFKGTALADLRKAYTYIGFEIRRRERVGETE